MELKINNFLNKLFEDLNNIIKKHYVTAWIITYHGKALTMYSGKSIWREEGFAKNAFISHLDYIYGYSEIKNMGFNNAKELADYLINSGIVKIKNL